MPLISFVAVAFFMPLAASRSSIKLLTRALASALFWISRRSKPWMASSRASSFWTRARGVLLPIVAVEGEDQGARNAGRRGEGGEAGEGRRKADEVETTAAARRRMRGRAMMNRACLCVMCVVRGCEWVGWTWSSTSVSRTRNQFFRLARFPRLPKAKGGAQGQLRRTGCSTSTITTRSTSPTADN